MREGTATLVRREDYAPPAYRIRRVDLTFDLDPAKTIVASRLLIERAEGTGAETPLKLHGEGLNLLRVMSDGASVSFRHEPGLLVIDQPPAGDSFTLEIRNTCAPDKNTALSGLYLSGSGLFTQCEAEGFRRITYFLDRPDVMASYRVTLRADKRRYPLLLAGGNLVEQGDLDGGRHYTVWEDPFPKPSYLFALVAADLVAREQRIRTRGGSEHLLQIYVKRGDLEKTEHAMRSLIASVLWDEARFALPLDLERFMVVAVDDFNMGAMENKGLNVFNTKYVLASPATATDDDFAGIESVIGHEYFHNWTGNRVTCRDWFQLSLKEGLTVFRDQEFTADMNSRPVKRIDDVRRLRTFQFAEDASPMAHPVRPDSYIEINNFYTVTVYEKGAEVVRLYQTLLGRDGFRKGMDLYFQRHDGEAVTTDHFRAAMFDANGIELPQFQRWYDQAGTPRVRARGQWDAATQSYELTLEQQCAPTPGQPEKQPFLIPVAAGLLGADGRDLPLRLAGESAGGDTTRVLHLTEACQTFRFEGVAEEPVPSLLRGFSAPVKLEFDYSAQQLMFLMAHDSDSFNRFEAGQKLVVLVMEDLLAEYGHVHALGLDPDFIDAFRATLTDQQADPALIAEALSLPSESYLAELFEPVNPEAIHAVRRFIRRTLAATLRDCFQEMYERLADTGPYRIDPESIGRRKLKNVCLSFLAELDDADIHEQAYRQFQSAGNMTDVLAALAALANSHSDEAEAALAEFEAKWRHDPLVLDKWFSLQAMSRCPDTPERVRELMNHPGFSMRNPNRVRALIGAFASGNPLHFHAADGSGYDFLVERILELDSLNPQVAARMIKPLTRWKHYEPGRSALMRAALERVAGVESLSRDVFEIVSKSLAD